MTKQPQQTIILTPSFEAKAVLGDTIIAQGIVSEQRECSTQWQPVTLGPLNISVVVLKTNENLLKIQKKMKKSARKARRLAEKQHFELKFAELTERFQQQRLQEEAQLRADATLERRRRLNWRRKGGKGSHDRAVLHHQKRDFLQATQLVVYKKVDKESRQVKRDRKIDSLSDDFTRPPSWVEPHAGFTPFVMEDPLLDENGDHVIPLAGDEGVISRTIASLSSSFPLLGDFLTYLQLLASQLGAPPSWLVSVLLLIDSLATATGPRQVLNALVSYFTRIDAPRDILDSLWSQLSGYFDSIVNKQSFGTPVGFLAAVMLHFQSSGLTAASSALWNKVTELYGLVAVSSVFVGIFRMMVPSQVLKRLSSLPIALGDFEGVFASILGLIKEASLALVDWASGKQHVWFAGSSFSQYIRRADELVVDKLARSEFLIDPALKRIKAKVYLEDLEKCVADGDVLSSVLGGSVLCKTIADKQKLLKIIIAETTFAISKLARAARPFIVALSGPPGLGKSTFASIVLDEIAEARGMFPPGAPHDATPFTWFPAGAKFADGFNGKKLVMLDDIGARGRKDETTVEEVMRLLRFGGNIPTVMNMADLTDKGRHYSDVYGVVVTSNETDYGFSCLPHPGAAFRRINIYVELTVKPKFAKDGNPHAVDPEKVSDKDRLHVWNIVFRAYRSMSSHPYAAADGPILLSTSNTAVAMKYLRGAIVSQMESELSHLRSLERKGDEKLCLAGVRWDYHQGDCCLECDYEVVLPQGYKWPSPNGFKFFYTEQPILPGLEPAEWEARAGLPTRIYLGLTRLIATFYGLNQIVGTRLLPPPPDIPVVVVSDVWSDKLRAGNYLGALSELKNDILKTTFFGAFALGTGWWFGGLFAALISFSSLSLFREVLHGSYRNGVRRVRLSFADIRHAMLAIWCQCDLLEGVVLSTVLLFGDVDRYAELLTYLWRRPTFMRVRLVNLAAMLATISLMYAVGVWFSKKGKSVEPQGGASSISWEPKKTSPWMNAVTHFHDSTPGAIQQVPKSTALQAVEGRIGVIMTSTSDWSNFLSIAGDVVLMVTHNVPKLPCVVDVFHNSRRQHRLVPLKFNLEECHVHHLGNEHTLVRLVGLRAVPSIVGMFQSKHCMTYGFQVKCAERTPDREPMIRDYLSYQKASGRFSVDGKETVVLGAKATGVATNGMCGSPVFALEPRLTYLGIHYGGRDEFAYSTRLSAEDLALGLEQLRVKSVVPSVPIIPQGFYTDLAASPQHIGIIPHPKSAFNNEVLEVDFLYCERSGSANPGSSVCPTEMGGNFSWLASQESLLLSPPAMSPKLVGEVWLDPGTEFLKKLVKDKKFVLSEWKQQLSDVLSMVGELPRRGPLDDNETLHGTPGRGGLVRINLQTSCGGHWGCKKSALFELTSNGTIVPSAEVERKWKLCVSACARGEMPPNFFTCVPKDEPVSQEKASKAVTRYIEVADVAYVLAVRQYASLPLMLALASITEVAIGMNCYSDEGDAWVRRMRTGTGVYMDVDIKQLDRSFGTPDFLLCVAFTLEVARRVGYTREQLETTRCLLFGMVQPVFSLRGSYFVADSLNASGHPLTVLWNSVVCLSLYLRWFRRQTGVFSPSLFRSQVTLSIYGDDGAMNCPRVWTYESVAASFLLDGFIATPGRKDASNGVVEVIEDMTFLKRSPRFHQGLQKWVMALSKKSIAKMLTWKVTSKWITPMDQEAAMLTNALWEAFLWEGDLLQRLLDVAPPTLMIFVIQPTLVGVQHRFETGELLSEDAEFVDVQDVKPHGFIYHKCEVLPPRNKNLALVTTCVTQFDDLVPQVGALRASEPRSIKERPYLGERFGQRKRGTGTIAHRCRALGVKQPSASLPIFNGSAQPESAMDQTTGPNLSQPATHEMSSTSISEGAPLQFLDAAPTLGSGGDVDFVADHDLILPAPDQVAWLERPRALYSYNWLPASGNSLFDPITTWFQSTGVSEKIKGYLGMRGSFHLRFVLNGTQMHYGRLMCALEPYPLFGSDRGFNCANRLKYGAENLSQLRHVMLDPACNDSYELCLPFMGRSEYYPVSNTNVSSYGYDLGDLTALHFMPMAALASVAAVTDPVSVSVYGWFEDVTLVRIGNVDPVIPHGGRKEMNPGVITQVSAIAAGATAALSNVFPGMSPLFRVANLFARISGGVAGALGLSLPNQIVPPIFVKLKNTNHLAHSTGLDTSSKLTLDPAACVSIDPRIVASSATDDMLISSIATRLSWIQTFNWAPTNNAGDGLAEIKVTPAYSADYLEDGFTNTRFTACGFAASGFSLWRSDMIFDLDIVASKFHSGRLLVVWEPNEPNGALSPLELVSSNYSWIIDLATQRKVRFRVPYVGPMAYRPVNFARPQYSCNGKIRVFVNTKLVSPAAVDDVKILVFVAAAENVEFAGPTMGYALGYHYNPQPLAGFAEEEIEETVDEVQPQGSRMSDVCSTVEVCLGPPTGLKDLSPIYLGERVTSLRQLVKRSTIYANILGIVSGDSSADFPICAKFKLPMFPYPAIRLSGGASENNCYWTPLTWYSQGFLAIRGSIRYRITASDPSNGHYLPMQVSRIIQGNPTFPFVPMDIDCSNWAMGYNDFSTYSWSGINESGPDQVQEVDLPYSETYKWLPAPYPNTRPGAVGMTGYTRNAINCMAGPFYHAANVAPRQFQVPVTIYSAAGEDTTLSWFTCGPTIARI